MAKRKARKTSIVTVTNKKGGVGKSTTVCNLAAVYAQTGKKILVIDLDHQSNATQFFEAEDQSKRECKNISEAFRKDLPLKQVILQTNHEGVSIVAGSDALEEETEKWNSHPKRFKLLEVLFNCDSLSVFDIVLIDTHPTFDCYLQSALTSSHYYLIPVFPEMFSVRGLGKMISRVESLKQYQNETLCFLGCLLAKYDKANKTHLEMQSQVREIGKKSGFNIFKTVIPVSKAVSGAEASKLPLNLYKPDIPISIAYSTLAGEILPQLSGKRTGRPKVQKLPSEIFGNMDIEEAAEF